MSEHTTEFDFGPNHPSSANDFGSGSGPASESGRHPVNTGHLVMGLAFAGLVTIWAVISSDLVADRDIRWLMPLPWVVAGGIGLAVAAWSNVRSKPGAQAPGTIHEEDR